LTDALHDFFWDLIRTLYRRGYRHLAKACLRTLGLVTSQAQSKIDFLWAGSDRTGQLISTNAAGGHFDVFESLIYEMCRNDYDSCRANTKFVFPIFQTMRQNAVWLKDFVVKVLEDEEVWIGQLGGQDLDGEFALLSTTGPCSIFLSSHLDTGHFDITAPLAMLNVHSLEVQELPSHRGSASAIPKLIYYGRRLHVMWYALKSSLRTVYFPWTGIPS
jgi:hypothetical protein